MFRPDATQDPLSSTDMANRLDLTAFHSSHEHPVVKSPPCYPRSSIIRKS